MTNKTATKEKGIAMDAVDVLMEARAYIEKGWRQGSFRSHAMKGGWHPVAWCAVGALHEAVNPGVKVADGWLKHDHKELVHEARTLLASVVRRPAASWNDDPDRTQAEVLEAFDRAVELGLNRISQ